MIKGNRDIWQYNVTREHLPSILFFIASRIAIIFLVLNVLGCGPYRTELEPVSTTYPRDPYTTETSSRLFSFKHGGNITLWNDSIRTKYAGRDAFNYDTYITKTGDNATVETFIHDKKDINSSRERLMTLAEKRGLEICGGKFAIIETTYFFGDEATPMFYGLSNVKSMRVKFRCSLKFTHSQVSQNRDIFNLSNELLWSNFFDILSFNFNKNAERLFEDLLNSAKQHEMIKIRAGKLSGNRYFYIGSVDMQNCVKQYKRCEQLAAIIEPIAQGSRIRIVFPALRLQKFKTSVSTRRRIPDQVGSLVPWQRDVAYDRARYFLSILEKVAMN